MFNVNMEIDSVLVDLNVISQLKNQDKLGVLTLRESRN